MNMSLAGGRPLASQAIEPLRKRRVGVSKTKAAIPVSAKKTSIRRKAFGLTSPPCPQSQCWGHPVTEWIGLRKKRPSLCHAFCSTRGNIEIGGRGPPNDTCDIFCGWTFFSQTPVPRARSFPPAKASWSRSVASEKPTRDGYPGKVRPSARPPGHLTTWPLADRLALAARSLSCPASRPAGRLAAWSLSRPASRPAARPSSRSAVRPPGRPPGLSAARAHGRLVT